MWGLSETRLSAWARDYRVALRRTAAAFFMILGATAIYYVWMIPTTLRVAVGPRDAEQVRFIKALASALEANGESFRLAPVIVEGTEKAGAALDSGTVDLAVLRSDTQTAREAYSIAVLHRRAMIVVARSSRVKKFADLRGKHIMVVQGAADANLPLIERALAHLGLGEKDVSLTEVDIASASAAMIQKNADALAFLAPPAGVRIRDIVADLVKAGISLSFIAPPAPEALALRFPFFETTKVPTGVFGGTPPKPPEDLDSIGVTHELVATRAMSDRTAAALTKALQSVRVRSYSNDGAPFAISAPPTDQPRRFKPHPGTRAYLDDEVKTLLETYSDYIWLALFGFGFLGSSLTALLAWLGVQSPAQSASLAGALPMLVDRAANAETIDEIEDVQREFDTLIAASLKDYATGALGNEGDERANWLSQAQSLIQRQRVRIQSGRSLRPQ